MPHKEGYGVVEECKRQPAKTAPFSYQMKTNPSTVPIGGKVPTKGSDVSGGNMNGGGKRR